MHTKLILAVLGAALAQAQSESASQTTTPPSPAVTSIDATASGVLPSNFSGPATTATALPAAIYQAVLPGSNFATGFETPLTGNITISSHPSKPGVEVHVDLHGFPSVDEYGPFIYHVHAAPVPENGNCTATLKHLDPTVRGEKPPCDPNDPSSCQVGDLSGKFGNITETDYAANYTDPFLSTKPLSPAFFGDKSIVIHTNNATRITCANFVKVDGRGPKAGPGGNGTSSAMPSSTSDATMSGGTSPASPTSSAPAAQNDGAGAATFGGLAVAAGLVAMVL